MEKHCGIIERVGDLTGGQLVAPVNQRGEAQWVGSHRVATSVDRIEVGGTVIKKPRLEDSLFQNLWPGRNACVYVYRHFRTPVIIGVKYNDDGSRFLISKSYLRGSMIQFCTIFAFMYGFGGLIVGGIIGGVLGLTTLAPVLASLVGLAAGGWSCWQAVKIRQAYNEAKTD